MIILLKRFSANDDLALMCEFYGIPNKVDKYLSYACLLYTSDAADERSSVDFGGRRIFKKKNKQKIKT